MTDLPPPDTKRWIAKRKAAVVRALRDGELPRAAARMRYGLSEEELSAWERGFAERGLDGLHATKRERIVRKWQIAKR